LVEDIQGSVDFYLAQSRSAHVDRVVLTGGSQHAETLRLQLETALGRPVQLANPLAAVTLGETVPESLSQSPQVTAHLPVSIGLALWGAGGRPAISLLPEGALQAKRTRRQTMVATLAVAAVAAALGTGWAVRKAQVSQAQSSQRQAEAKNTRFQQQIAALHHVTEVNADFSGWQKLYATALGKDVDSIRLLQQIAAVMPANVHLQTLVVSVGATGGNQATPSSQAATASTSDGTLTVTAAATSKEDVAAWLRALSTLPGLQTVWVSSISQTPAVPAQAAPVQAAPAQAAPVQAAPASPTPVSEVTFSSSAIITPAAESARAVTAAASAQ
jgi:Tfp pilus assembly protein PilN